MSQGWFILIQQRPMGLGAHDDSTPVNAPSRLPHLITTSKG